MGFNSCNAEYSGFCRLSQSSHKLSTLKARWSRHVVAFSHQVCPYKSVLTTAKIEIPATTGPGDIAESLFRFEMFFCRHKALRHAQIIKHAQNFRHSQADANSRDVQSQSKPSQ